MKKPRMESTDKKERQGHLLAIQLEEDLFRYFFSLPCKKTITVTNSLDNIFNLIS